MQRPDWCVHPFQPTVFRFVAAAFLFFFISISLSVFSMGDGFTYLLLVDTPLSLPAPISLPPFPPSLRSITTPTPTTTYKQYKHLYPRNALGGHMIVKAQPALGILPLEALFLNTDLSLRVPSVPEHFKVKGHPDPMHVQTTTVAGPAGPISTASIAQTMRPIANKGSSGFGGSELIGCGYA